MKSQTLYNIIKSNMEKSIVSLDVFLPPCAFDADVFYDKLLESIRMKETTCDHEIGYIDQIFRVVDIKNSLLMDDGLCKLKVDVECNVFKPDIGKQVDVEIKTISEHGIFAELGKNRFLIPSDTFKNHTIDRGEVFDVAGRALGQGSIVKIEIINFRYDYKCFCCIGKFADG